MPEFPAGDPEFVVEDGGVKAGFVSASGANVGEPAWGTTEPVGGAAAGDIVPVGGLAAGDTAGPPARGPGAGIGATEALH